MDWLSLLFTFIQNYLLPGIGALALAGITALSGVGIVQLNAWTARRKFAVAQGNAAEVTKVVDKLFAGYPAPVKQQIGQVYLTHLNADSKTTQPSGTQLLHAESANAELPKIPPEAKSAVALGIAIPYADEVMPIIEAAGLPSLIGQDIDNVAKG
jgi:hypothetical protein